jgi:alpha-galactosidase
MPERKAGWSGAPAIRLIDRASPLAGEVPTDLRVRQWGASERDIWIDWEDETCGMCVTLWWRIRHGDIVNVSYDAASFGWRDFVLADHPALVLPIPARFTGLTTYSGRWAGEMRESCRPIAPDGYSAHSGIGKPGFGGGNWLLLHSGEEVLGAHLAWSGDHWLALAPDNQGAGDGRALLLMGAELQAGEAVLAPGESITTPAAPVSRRSRKPQRVASVSEAEIGAGDCAA